MQRASLEVSVKVPRPQQQDLAPQLLGAEDGVPDQVDALQAHHLSL